MESAAENLPWIVPHFGAIASDLSVYHRIDNVDDIGMIRFVQLLEHLHAYGGAYATSVAAAQAQRAQPGERPAPDGDTPEQEIQAQWNAVLAREFPEHYQDGIEVVSADEMVRQVSG